MLQYIVRRIAMVLLSIFILLTLVFFTFHLVPGDPAQEIAGQQTQIDVERVREYLGLNDPVFVQYMRYLGNAIRGDLGVSAILQGKISHAVRAALPYTLLLVVTSMSLAVLIGIPLGTVAAVKYRSMVDYVMILAVVVLLSMPNFWIGLILINWLSVRAGLFPTCGFSGFSSVVLPSFAIAARLIAIVARMSRSSMLEVIRQDYIQTARAKGLKERVVIYKHALRNALIPTVTVIGLQIGYLVGGAIVIEVLFAWPGIGQLTINAIRMRDYNMVQGTTLVFVTGFLVVNLIIDLLYGYLDPRIRYD